MCNAVVRGIGVVVIGAATLMVGVSSAAAQTVLSATPTVVAPGDAVTLNASGPPGHFLAFAGSTVGAGLSYGGVGLPLGPDVQVITIVQLDASGQATIQFSPPFSGTALDRFYVLAVSSASPDFLPPNPSNSVILRNRDTVGATAGGDLMGTFPNPSIAPSAGANIVTAINATGGVIDDAHIPATIARSSAVLSTTSPIGGDLNGTVGNPSIAATAGSNIVAAINSSGGVIAESRIPSSIARTASVLSASTPVGGDLAGTIATPTIAASAGQRIVNAINASGGTIAESRLPASLVRLTVPNTFTALQQFNAGLSAGSQRITGVGNPIAATDATNRAYTDANFLRFVPPAEQLSVGDANGTAPMINLRGGSTCCSGPGGHTPAWFKVFQNGSFVATGNLGIGVSPMQGQGYRTSWDSYKGSFRSGYASNEWDDANVGFFSWAGGSNSTAAGLYAFAFGDTNTAHSTSSVVFGSGNEVKGAAGFSAGAGNRVCDTYGVALGNNARSGGPLINGRCDPEPFNLRGLAAVAIGYNVTADQDHTTAMGKFASNNGFQGTFVWSDGAATQSADTFRNLANNEFAARATGGFRFRTNLGGTTGCNLPAGSGVFTCTSSRATKANFIAVDGEDVLSRLEGLPMSTWNYITEAGVRHMGPMAEDFYQAFALGTDNSSIGVQDLAAVSLAAAKALDERTRKLTRENQALRAETEALRAELAAIRDLLQNKH